MGEAFHAMCRVALLLLALLAGLWPPSPAQAGAWARAPGELFLSFSSNMQGSVTDLAGGMSALDRYDSAYLELGLGHRLTFGAELGRGTVTHEALVFLRYTLTPDDARMQLAVDFGAGQRRVAGNEDATLLRLGLSLGRGFALDPPDWLPLPVSGGWMALDGTAVQDLAVETTRWKVEATLGLTAWDRHSLMLQLVAEEWPGQDVTWGINPSVVFALGAATSLELGLRATFAEVPQYGLELGLWHRF